MAPRRLRRFKATNVVQYVHDLLHTCLSRARMSEPLERPCTRVVVIVPCRNTKTKRARVVARRRARVRASFNIRRTRVDFKTHGLATTVFEIAGVR
eukprot:5004310-Pyramimonas_sp.AAC.1